MKLFRNTILTALIAVLPLLATSCRLVEADDDESSTISVEPAYFAVPASATSVQFNVTSNANWVVESSASWITDYTQSGSRNGVITVNFPANNSLEEERSAAFSVIAGKKAVALSVTQARVGAEVTDAVLSAKVLSLEVPADATEASFDIHSNTIWGVYTEDDWFYEYTKMGEGDGQLVIKFDTYKNRKVDRVAKFLVTAREAAIELVLTQIKTDKIEIIDSNVGKFLAEAEDDDLFYRLQGFITEITDPVNGVITIKDAFGSIKIDGLLNKANGESGKFETLGAKVGDAITVVGTRGNTAGIPALSHGFWEKMNKVENVTLDQFIAAAGGDDTWYQFSGIVCDITNSEKGCFTLKDPISGSSVTVDGLLPGLNGNSGQFSLMNISADDKLTLISTGKSGNTVTNGLYVSHRPGKYPAGVLAMWTFDAGHMNSLHTPDTWAEGTIDTSSSLGTTVGDTGRYVMSDEGNGKMSYWQADRGDMGGWAALFMYNTGQPGFDRIWIGDAFVFELATSMMVPAGTKIKASFCMRIPSGSLGCYMLEYYADGEWHVAEDAANPVKSISVDGVNYNYNIQRTGNNVQTLQTYTFMTGYDIPQNELKIRIRAAAPYNTDSKAMTKPNGAARFRGIVDNQNLSPKFEVI